MGRFQFLHLPNSLLSLDPSKDSQSASKHRRKRLSPLYLTVVSYIHLLGLRAMNFFETGCWDIVPRPPSPCTLSAFTVQLAPAHSPHNMAARQIFISSFLRAARHQLYSAVCIGGGLLDQEHVGRAFEHALYVQILVQKQRSTGKDQQDTYHQQQSAAIKIAKWLLLHQVFWMDGSETLAHLVAEIGPSACSSDESDDDDSDTAFTRKVYTTKRVSRSPQWRGTQLATFIDLLRQHRLYPPNQRSIPQKHSFPKRPPNGMPLSWISEAYLVDSLSLNSH